MAEEMKQQAAVRSFRVTDEVMAQFKGIQEEMGLTQDGALKMLVQAYELEAAKNAIPDRETEIANFQTKAGELVAAFLNALQLNQDAEVRARAEVELQMQNKDKTIATLHEKLDGIKVENAKLATAAETARTEIQALAEDLSSARKTEDEVRSALADKERIIAMQEKQISEMEDLQVTVAKTSELLDAATRHVNDLQAQLNEQVRARESAERTVQDLTAQMQKLGAEHERDLQVARKEAEAERRQAVLEAREEAQAKIEGYVTKIEAKDAEIARLRDEAAARKSAKRSASKAVPEA